MQNLSWCTRNIFYNWELFVASFHRFKTPSHRSPKKAYLKEVNIEYFRYWLAQWVKSWYVFCPSSSTVSQLFDRSLNIVFLCQREERHRSKWKSLVKDRKLLLLQRNWYFKNWGDCSNCNYNNKKTAFITAVWNYILWKEVSFVVLRKHWRGTFVSQNFEKLFNSW